VNISINKTQAVIFIGVLIGLSFLVWKHQERIANAFGGSQPDTISPMANMMRTCKSFQNGSALAHWHGFGTQGTMFDNSEA